MGKQKDLTPKDLGLSTSSRNSDPDQDVEVPKGPPSEVAKFWEKELGSAREREKDYRKQARNVVCIYEADKEKEAIPFNILYSNTETLLPVLYSQVPRPVVRRRQRNNNDLKALLASRVAQRMLEYFLDDGLGESPGFEELAQRSCLQALVAGRGLMRFRYEAEIEKVMQPVPEEEGGQPGQTREVEQLKNEYICAEYVEWDKVLLGYARVWKDVPWLAFEHAMSRDELIRMFGERLGKQVPLNLRTSDDGQNEDDDTRDVQVPADSEGAKLAQVYEIWDKVNKKVIFYAPDYKQDILKQLDDPLGLSGFFPCGEPLSLFLKMRSMVPKPLYAFYESQATELNRITVRIDKIIAALKVRGFYDSQLGSLSKLMEQDDNTLLPAENVAAMLQGQTLEKSIWLMPLEKLVAVLQQLYVQRNQVKSLIYEITGISDVLRGASAASETLGAQEMKQTWATIRIKRMQKAVMKYLRSNLRVMAELGIGKLAPDTIAQMTGVSLPTAEDKAQAQMQLQAMQQAAAMQPPAPPAPPMPGAPAPQSPAPPQPDPKLVQTLQTPTMEEVLATLQNDLMRSYLIDIETNSTLESEATEDKQQVGEFLNAMAQFMSGIAPLIQTKVMPFEAAQSILVNVTRRYRMGDEVEEALMKMQPPQMDANGEGGKGKDIEGEKELMKAKVAMQQAELDIKRQLGELQIAVERMRMDLEREKMDLERQKVRTSGELEREKMGQKRELSGLRHRMAMEDTLRKAQMGQTAPAGPGAQPAGPAAPAPAQG